MTRKMAVAGAVVAAALAVLAVPGIAVAQDEATTTDAVVTAEGDEGTTGTQGPDTVTPPEPADTTDATDPVEPVEPADSETAEPSTSETVEPEYSAADKASEQAPGDEYDAVVSSASCASKKGGSDNAQVHDDLREQGCEVSIESEGEIEIDGITFTFTFDDTPQGQVVNFTTNQPFTGTILVKGGKFHFSCVFEDPVTEGQCHAPVNPNNGKFHDVSHVDVCVDEFPDIPPPPDDGGNGGGGGGGGGGVEREVGVGEAPQDVVAAVSAEELPFTGVNLPWLLLLSGGLLGCGAFLRTRTD